MGHHARHAHTVPVQVLQEDVRIPPGKRASLGDEAEQRVQAVHTDMSSLCTTDRSTGLYHTSEASIWPMCSLENTKAESHCNKNNTTQSWRPCSDETSCYVESHPWRGPGGQGLRVTPGLQPERQ